MIDLVYWSPMKNETQEIEEIRHLLISKLRPKTIEIFDHTDKHRGHQEFKLRGGMNLEIHLSCEQFAGLNRLQRERLVQEVLKNHLQSGLIHALSLKLKP